MDMARVEIPVSGWTCLRTKVDERVNTPISKTKHENENHRNEFLTLIDVGGVGLLSGLAALLLLTRGGSCGLLPGFLLLCGSLATSGGLTTGARLLLSGFRRHF